MNLNERSLGENYTKGDKTMSENKVQSQENAIVTSGEIRTILQDFCIGKKPLAKLLGWGETTIIRYIEGDVPTAEYSGKLKSIVEDPVYYYELLLENKDNLNNVAYRKTMQAVLEKMTERKINLIAQYMIYYTQGDLSPGYTQWLLYYAQGFFLALYERELFEDEFSVNGENAPYISLYNSMKKHGINIFEVPVNRLSELEKNLINKVLDTFCWYGPKALKVLAAYERTNYRISRNKDGQRIIAKELIKSQFKDIMTLYGIRSLNEIHKYPDGKFMEIKGIS